MQIKFTAEPAGDALAYFAFEGEKGVEFAAGVDKPAEAAFRRAMTASSFKASAGQSLEILAPEWSDSARVILVGVGKKKSLSDITWQKAAAGMTAVFPAAVPRASPLARPRLLWDTCASARGRSSMVERKLPKLHTRVRFPPPAP